MVAQAPLRCDLQLESTPGAVPASACLDLVALQTGGAPIVTAGNATRISVNGFKLCPNAFTVTKPAGADIVFIYDNSGSMSAGAAKVDTTTSDTTFYHIDACLNAPSTPLTFTTLLGERTIRLVGASASCGNTSYAGDPYFARGKIIEKAIDYLVANSPNSTAGAMGFEEVARPLRTPLQLSIAGNPELVKNSIVLDSIRATNYVPALKQAREWLTNSAYIMNSKQAIVFISDGEPSDGRTGGGGRDDLTPWLRIDSNKTIPIYTIALGDSNMRFTRMQEMSDTTDGAFYQIPPKNIARMNEVMTEIIKAITVPIDPLSIEVSNNSFPTPMVSKSTSITTNADGSKSPVMDSILALKQGTNALTVKITLSANDVRNFNLAVQADGPAAAVSTQNLVCYPMPILTLLNPTGGVDLEYANATALYDVRLTRASSDLKEVIVVATSSDSGKTGWGDLEQISVPQTTSSGTSTVNQRNDYSVNGAAVTATKGNGALDAAPGGGVLLTWTHPRDLRETASFSMTGKKPIPIPPIPPPPPIPTVPGFVSVDRATDAPRGVPIPAIVTDPVVVRGGVTLVRNATGAVLTHKGDLWNPHKVADAILDPNHTPTFIFTTASAYSYEVKIFDHLGQFLNERKGTVNSDEWERMRGTADSLSSAFSILPISKNGQRYGTGVYILQATITTIARNRTDPGKPSLVTPKTRSFTNRFGYIR